MQSRYLIVAAALSMALAVACGAFGAHALKNNLSPEMLAVWQVGVQYQMLHSMAVLVLALFAFCYGQSHGSVNQTASFSNTRKAKEILSIQRVCLIMLLGIVLFSASLYVLAVTGIRWLGAITPLGGLAFITAWLMLGWTAWRGFKEI